MLGRSIIPVIFIALLFGLMVMPVENRWAQADVVLSWCIMAMLASAVALWGFAKLSGKKTESGGWEYLDMMIVVGAIYYLVHTWMGDDYPCSTAFLKTMEAFLLYYALRCVMSYHVVSDHWMIAGLLFCGLYEAGLGISQMESGFSRNFRYMMTGTFQNPGPYAAILMMGSVAGIALVREMNVCWLKNVVIGVVGFMFVLLPATWSRAALLSLLVVGLIMFRKWYWRWRWAVWTGCMLLCVAFYCLKQGSADGRLLTWVAALTMWTQRPWMGVGTGGFLHAVADGVSELYSVDADSTLFASGGVTDYAFNDFIFVLVEQGMVGILMFGGVVAYTTYLLWMYSKPLFYAFLSLLLFSMFSYPMELFPYRTISVMMMAWGASIHSRKRETKISYARFLLPLLLLIPSYALAKEVTCRQKADQEYLLFSGMEHEAFIKDYYELLPLEDDHAKFLFNFGKLLRLHGRYNDSNAMLKQGTRVSADPMFYVLMGNNYRDMKSEDLAEEAYQKAYAVMPNRVYPLYQLVQLYRETGDSTNAKAYAKEIILFKEKVSSPATRQIKREMRLYLDGVNKKTLKTK